VAYDANGNLLSDGLTSYAWNARNQLAGLTGAASASFAYDAQGQRRARTTSGTTSYLYDGPNAAQELVGGSATASVLAGGVDEVFQRIDGAGTRAVLTDALGSTVALVDGSGVVQAQYTSSRSERRRRPAPAARTRRNSPAARTTPQASITIARGTTTRGCNASSARIRSVSVEAMQMFSHMRSTLQLATLIPLD
jgi:YD repeat-containing protein